MTTKTEKGFCPLLIAALHGRTKILARLIELGASIVDAKTNNGANAFQLAKNSDTSLELLSDALEEQKRNAVQSGDESLINKINSFLVEAKQNFITPITLEDITSLTIACENMCQAYHQNIFTVSIQLKDERRVVCNLDYYDSCNIAQGLNNIESEIVEPNTFYHWSEIGLLEGQGIRSADEILTEVFNKSS